MESRANRKTINVKGVRAEAWERAGAAAKRQDQSLGEWVSRACDLLADMESGEREFGPSQPVKPRKELTPEQVAALLQGVAATAGSRHRAAVDLRLLASEMARDALGLEPIPVRSRAIPSGNLGRVSRQSALISGVPIEPGAPE